MIDAYVLISLFMALGIVVGALRGKVEFDRWSIAAAALLVFAWFVVLPVLVVVNTWQYLKGKR